MIYCKVLYCKSFNSWCGLRGNTTCGKKAIRRHDILHISAAWSKRSSCATYRAHLRFAQLYAELNATISLPWQLNSSHTKILSFRWLHVIQRIFLATLSSFVDALSSLGPASLPRTFYDVR